MKYSIFVLLLSVGITACNNKKNEPVVEDNKEEKVVNTSSISVGSRGETYIWPDTLKNIFAVPDSIARNPEKVGPNWTIDKIWTPEEKALAKLIMGTFIENVEVKNGKLAFTITPQEYVAKGIPEPYYYMFSQNLQSISANKSAVEVVQFWEKRKEKIRKDYFSDKE